MKTLISSLLLAAALAVPGISPALAQEYPTRSVTIVVPYAPGATDQLARALAQGMSEELGQPVVVETRPGAGGTVGANSVAGSEADGYTLLMAVSSVQTVAPHQRELPYQFESLTPIARIAVGPNVMAARTGAPYATMEELVGYAKENPGEVSFGSAGTGGATHIAGEAFARAAGIELFHIPFDGVTPAITATVAGDVDLVLGYASAIAPQVEGGNLVMLAQFGEERTSVQPDVPTLKESGVDLVLPPNIGLWAPAGTPADVVDKIAAAAETAAKSQQFLDYGRSTLTEISYVGPQGFAAELERENQFYADLLAEVGLARQ